jgi:LacI family transcriptional regulator
VHEGIDVSAVVIDNYEASRLAVSTFCSAGHRRIGFAWGPPAEGPAPTREEMWDRSRATLWSDGERLRGYLDGLQEAGIPYDPALVTYCDRSEGDVADAVERMLRSDDRMTAVLTTETEALTGTLLALGRAGLAYPDDLSIIGFDDSPWARAVRPSLTMIAQPVAEMGRAAAERAFSYIRGEAQRAEILTLHAALQLRSSVSGPASATLR